MADEDLDDIQSNQVDGILPPEGSFVDEEDARYQDRNVREDAARQTDWRRAANEIKKQAGGGGPKSDSPATGSQAYKSAGGQGAGSSGGQAIGAPPQQAKPAPPAGEAKTSAANAGSSGAGKAAGGSAGGKAGGGKAGMAKQAALNLAADRGNVKETAKDTAQIVADQASDKAVLAATGGIVGFKGGTATREILERKKTGKGIVGARVSALVNNITIFFIPLKYWLWALVIVQLLIWVMVMMIVVISMVAVCEAVSYKIFGFDVGVKVAGSITGVDLTAICGEVSKLASGIPGLGGGGGDYGSGTCDVIHDPASGCDVDRLRAACDWDPNLASQICNKESAGGYNPGIGGTADYCYPDGPNGRKLPMSIGYFQFNIFNSYSPEFVRECTNVLNNEGCWEPLVELPGTNIKYCKKRKCSFGPRGEDGYNECVRAMSDPERNIRQACNMYHQRGWQPWSAAKVCKIIP